MCLDTIEHLKLLPQGEQKAYQVFHRSINDGFLVPLYMKVGPSRIGDWEYATHAETHLETTPLWIDDDCEYYQESYPVGFHVFRYKESARALLEHYARVHNMDEQYLVVAEVTVKEIHTYGTQNGRECWVARQRKIERIVE